MPNAGDAVDALAADLAVLGNVQRLRAITALLSGGIHRRDLPRAAGLTACELDVAIEQLAARDLVSSDGDIVVLDRGFSRRCRRYLAKAGVVTD